MPGMTEPLISVITVVFNNKDHIEKTILSIAAQTFKNYEHIIIDGASTDGTLDIINKYKSRLGYFISEPDKGIYDAMNKGIKAAKGKYLWFMNSGDLIESPETMQAIFSEEQDADVYYGETLLMDESGKIIGTRSEKSTRKLPRQLKAGDMKYGMVVSHQSIIVKRSIAPEYNLEYRCSADIDWVITSLKRSKKIINCHRILSKYLIGGFSIKNQRKSWNERYQIYCKQYGLLLSWWAHTVIIIRAIWYKAMGKDNY
jgi:glycosyltransferase involved in cell wall biosynthesis